MDSKHKNICVVFNIDIILLVFNIKYMCDKR